MLTVRDGQKVWPYCEECGCRLNTKNGIIQHWWGEHEYQPNHVVVLKSDARGHKCSKLIDFWIVDDNGNPC
jgi:hypothetical protein